MNEKSFCITGVSVLDVENWFTDLPAFPGGHRFELDPCITWIVGNNGCGKSSLLHMLREYSQGEKDLPILPSVRGQGRVSFFDTERMNPRTKAFSQNPDVFAYEVCLVAKRASHGQALYPILIASTRSEKFRNAALLIDEPESGISPWNQKALLAAWQQASKERGTQYIIATHSMLFIESGVGSVLDLNQHPARLVPAKDYKLFPE